MTAYAPPQHPSAPPMYPAEALIRPNPPPREDQDRIQQESLLSKPKPPKRDDIPGGPTYDYQPSKRRSTGTGQNIRKDENEENPGDTNGDCLYNYNSYATIKTIGLGLLVLALMTSNAMQLRMLILQKQRDTVWTISLVLVCLSFAFQIGTAFLLVIIGKSDIRSPQNQSKLGRYNILSLVIIIIITIMNVAINFLMLSINPNSFFHLIPSSESSLTNNT